MKNAQSKSPKKIIKKILIFSILQMLFLFMVPTIANADACKENKDCAGGTGGQVCYEGKCMSTEDLYLPDLEDYNLDKTYQETKAVSDLPRVSQEGFFTTIIKTILAWAMSLTIIAIVVSAIYYLQSRGQEEDVTKAKNIIIYLVIGMAIMAAAYGIVAGVTKFDFFEAAK